MSSFCNGDEFIESKSFINFLVAIDPNNVLNVDRNALLSYPCYYKLHGVKCDLRSSVVIEIRLKNMNLSGVINAESLCKLSNLRVLSLVRNKIEGNVPESISSCRSLTTINANQNTQIPRKKSTTKQQLFHKNETQLFNDFSQSYQIFTKVELQSLNYKWSISNRPKSEQITNISTSPFVIL
ncbi:hypothetical protein RDI58_004169 [Solanum bulbocastanum]|uniref:Uncharacterized protein n=1 Tax=Solanum bulbocastanum TaxID=147425 RepID=A0AAN8YPP4_SOLBU